LIALGFSSISKQDLLVKVEFEVMTVVQ